MMSRRRRQVEDDARRLTQPPRSIGKAVTPDLAAEFFRLGVVGIEKPGDPKAGFPIGWEMRVADD